MLHGRFVGHLELRDAYEMLESNLCIDVRSSVLRIASTIRAKRDSHLADVIADLLMLDNKAPELRIRQCRHHLGLGRFRGFQGIVSGSRLSEASESRKVTVEQEMSTAMDQKSALDTAIYNLREAYPLDAAHEAISDKHAAVLCLLFERDSEIFVWLTQRSSKMRSHAGEVCFPGGKRDAIDELEGDADINTSLREAHEEIGLDATQVNMVAKMPPCLSKHLLSVTCCIAATTAGFTPVPNPAEVEVTFEAPLSLFLHPEKGSHSFKDIQWEGHKYRLHFFEHNGQTIWGLTAYLLTQIAKAAFKQETSYKERGPGSEDYALLYNDPVQGLMLRSIHEIHMNQ